MKRALLLFALLEAIACSPDQAPPPELTLSPSPLCADSDAAACLNAGARTDDVSGVHVIYKRVKGEPVVALQVFFDGGDGGDVGGEQLWSEYFALGLVDQEGSKDLGLTAWPAKIRSVGGSIDAGRGNGYGYVYADAPVSYWSDLWALVAGAITNPANDEHVLSFLRQREMHSYDTELDDPADAARVAAQSALLRGQPYGRFRDTKSLVDTISTSDVAVAWNGMLTKERLWIVVVGDVDRADLASKVSTAFGNLPAHTKTRFPAPPPTAPFPTSPLARVLDYPDAPSWQIYAYFAGPNVADEDYPAFTVGVKLLDQRLYREVRQLRGLAYSVGATARRGNPALGALQLATAAPSDALPVVKEAISSLISNPIADEELEASRGLVRSDVLSGIRTPSDIAYVLGGYQLLDGDRHAVESYLERVSTTTEAEARQAVARYLKTPAFGAAGPGDAVDRESLLALVPNSAPGDAGP